MKSGRKFFEDILTKADITIDGTRPQDIIVHDERFFNRVIQYGSLGLGESYMDGWWDAHSLDTFIHKIFTEHLEKKFEVNIASVVSILRAWLFNLQSNLCASKVGEIHYDLGNDLFKAMLDSKMVYTCGYWKDATTLDEAQKAKLDLVCRKIGLKKDDHILDIGCGWGSFAKFATEEYGASVVGITISKEQAVFARKLCEGLPIEIRVQDYREVNEQFDHIISLGMFEHVGYKNYDDYFAMASRCLKEDGLFLLHTIGYFRSQLASDPWFEKYIFPGGSLVSIAQIGKAIEGFFLVEDLHNFGADYDKTLMAWFANFDEAWSASVHEGEKSVLHAKYGDRFYRMWKYYLLSVAGGFRARQVQLWQIVLSKNGVRGGYNSVR